LALVRDVRVMDYRSGTTEVSFRDVSARIDATSVHFMAKGVAMLEQNFDYDLVSSDKLLQKYVDKQIVIIGKDGTSAQGTLLSSGKSGGSRRSYGYDDDNSGSQLILKQEDGSLRSIMLENATEIRYPSLPEGLITRPTLNWQVKADNSGSKETEVTYLTGGLSWRADYALNLNDENSRADVSAWVTLSNSSGASYKDAKLKLIAGDINRARQEGGERMMVSYSAKEVRGGGEPQFEEKSFFEYHLYTLQRPTSVLNNQTKQVSLFPNTTAPVKKFYEYNSARKLDRVGVSIEMVNSEANGLGMPLPAGRVRIFQKDTDGSNQFLGEDSIKHTPKNETFRVRVGEAFDIVVDKTKKDFRQISNRVTETDWEVKLRNHKKEYIEVTVVDNPSGDWEITKSSLEYKKISANRIEFTVPVKTEEEPVLTYTVRNRQ
jgi:hypothetical protein